jgi:hypothetical protein
VRFRPNISCIDPAGLSDLRIPQSDLSPDPGLPVDHRPQLILKAASSMLHLGNARRCRNACQVHQKLVPQMSVPTSLNYHSRHLTTSKTPSNQARLLWTFCRESDLVRTIVRPAAQLIQPAEDGADQRLRSPPKRSPHTPASANTSCFTRSALGILDGVCFPGFTHVFSLMSCETPLRHVAVPCPMKD